LLALSLSLGGCANAISPELRRKAAPVEGLAQVRADLETFVGETVILGGEIVETRNEPAGTTLLVLEKALGSGQEPKLEDVSGGRFMVRFAGYLDPALFAPSRRVTVAGTVTGAETERVGDAPYDYVVLAGAEVYLWEKADLPPHSPWRAYQPWYPWWYDPYWGRRPWWY
jgi:outer membrane lipoprotein